MVDSISRVDVAVVMIGTIICTDMIGMLSASVWTKARFREARFGTVRKAQIY